MISPLQEIHGGTVARPFSRGRQRDQSAAQGSRGSHPLGKLQAPLGPVQRYDDPVVRLKQLAIAFLPRRSRVAVKGGSSRE
jgi:hypothetical protein